MTAKLPSKLAAINTLSQREMQIFLQVANGKPQGAIARELDISPRSVNSYILRVQKKTGFTTCAQLILYAYRAGLTTWPLPNFEGEQARHHRLRLLEAAEKKQEDQKLEKLQRMRAPGTYAAALAS